MNCDEARWTLQERMGGGMSADVASGLDEHLMSCPPCRGAWDELLAVDGLLRRRPAAAPPPDLAVAILARLARAGAADRPLETFRREASPIALAAAVLLGALGLWIALSFAMPTGDQLVETVSATPAWLSGLGSAVTALLAGLGAAVADLLRPIARAFPVPALPEVASPAGFGLFAAVGLLAILANAWLFRLPSGRQASSNR